MATNVSTRIEHIPAHGAGPPSYPLPGQQESIAALRGAIEQLSEHRRCTWSEEIDDSLQMAGPFSVVVTIASGFLTLILLSPQRRPLDSSPPASFESLTWALNNIDAVNVVGALWFSSLALTITSSFIGLVCKQWLREYTVREEADDTDAIATMQLRLLGLQTWLVPQTVSSVFIIFQLALVTFFAGLSVLLWIINTALAIPLIAIEGCVVAFYCITTLWPIILYSALHSGLLGPFTRLPYQVPWKSPQALIVLRFSEMLSHAITTLRARIHRRSSAKVNASISDNIVRAHTWRLYDYFWMDLLDRPGLLVKAGPSVHPIVVRAIPRVLRHIPLASQSSVTYHLLSTSLLAYQTRCALINFSQQRSVRDVAAEVGHMGLVPRPNWTLVMRLFIDVFPDEGELGKLQLCFKEWDTCGEYGAACSAEFTQAVLLLVIGRGGETGVEHCCRIVDGHISHAGDGGWQVPEGFTTVFERHLNEVTKKVASGQEATSLWDPMDDMLINKCLRPLLDVGQCDLLLNEKRTTLTFVPHIIDYYVARRNHQLLIEVVRSLTKWALNGASKWPPADARAALYSLDDLMLRHVAAADVDDDAVGPLKRAVGVLGSMMEIVVRTAGDASDFGAVRNAILELHVPCEGKEDVDSMIERMRSRLSE